MNYIVFEDRLRSAFLPLTYTNTVADLLIGAFSNRQRWEHHFEARLSTITDPSLAQKFPTIIEEDNLLVNSRLIPSKEILKEIKNLPQGRQLISTSATSPAVLALRISGDALKAIIKSAESKDSLSISQALSKSDLSVIRSEYSEMILENVWDFYKFNSEVFKIDASIIEEGEFETKLKSGNTKIGEDKVYIHPKANVKASVLNTEGGPIIIDESAEVMEGCLIRGPFYLGKNAVLKMGSKVYGASSIGDYSKVGGEVNNCIVNSFSNKAHDGFIGNSVIGQWCNLGADTNTSNLKNDYSIVKLWNFEKESFVKSEQQFLGLIMGDHSKCGINTMFNTGTVVGVCCNVYGSGFQPNYIPSFSWGKPGAFATYQFNKAKEVIQRVMERRKLHLTGTEENLLQEIFEVSEAHRLKFNKAS